MIPAFNIILVGDSGVGKSTLIKRLLTGAFEEKYVATLGINVLSLVFNTTRGLITLNLFDTAGQEKFDDMRIGYYTKAQGVIGMFDTSNKLSIKHLSEWIADVVAVAPSAPVVICGNKCDIPVNNFSNIMVDMVELNKRFSSTYMYYHISAKTNYSCENPFLFLMRKLTYDNKLEIIPNGPVNQPCKRGVVNSFENLRQAIREHRNKLREQGVNSPFPQLVRDTDKIIMELVDENDV